MEEQGSAVIVQQCRKAQEWQHQPHTNESLSSRPIAVVTVAAAELLACLLHAFIGRDLHRSAQRPIGTGTCDDASLLDLLDAELPPALVAFAFLHFVAHAMVALDVGRRVNEQRGQKESEQQVSTEKAFMKSAHSVWVTVDRGTGGQRIS